MANVSPLSPLPLVGFTLTLPDNGTVVEADPAPFNNTKELVVLNLDGDNRVFMQIVDVGEPPALPAAVDVNLGNSTVIPAGASFSVCLGSEGSRHAISTVAGWTANGPGSQFILVFKAESGNDVNVNITYVQSIGGASGPKT